MLYGNLVEFDERAAEAAAESQQSVSDPDDFPLGAPACNLDGECESCQ